MIWVLACASAGTMSLGIGGTTVTVEVADDPGERERGLMYRDALGADAGMLFVYPEARERSFWMRNTKVPLSIAYLDSRGIVVHLADMTPHDESPVPSEAPAQYALEMNRGWFAAHGVKVGDVVTGLPPASPK
ncbi:MAG: DUF192 domain-containing protein [Myxococcota bacterium]